MWEGIRLHKQKLVFIEEHIDRLFASAKGISLNISLSRQDILDELHKVLIKNNMNDDNSPDLQVQGVWEWEHLSSKYLGVSFLAC